MENEFASMDVPETSPVLDHDFHYYLEVIFDGG